MHKKLNISSHISCGHTKMNYIFSPLMLYFFKHASIYFFSILIVLSFITSLSELIEYSKQTSHFKSDAFFICLKLTLYKTPTNIQELLPYATFFGSMLSLIKLSKNLELIIARSSGFSIWHCCFPHVVLAFLVGLFSIMIFSSIASVTQTKLLQLEHQYLNKDNNNLQLSGGGFWLHQKEGDKTAIIHASKIDPEKMILNKVIIFRYTKDNKFYERIDGDNTILENGYWKIDKGIKTNKNLETSSFINLQLPTQLTSSQIKESFARPETISFWGTPKFIKVIEKAGFNSRKHVIYLHKMLSTPIFLIGMVLLGAIFSVKPIGRHGAGKRLFIAIIIAFVIFFLNDVIAALGQGSQTPAFLAAWIPALIPVFISTSILLYLEDG